MLSSLIQAITQAADIKSLQSPKASSIQPVGLFRVRREISVDELMLDVMKQLLSSSENIEVSGVRIGRPKEITITMTNLNKLQFKPDFPVNVSVAGMLVNTNISAVELVKDDESGFPALLFTTSSSLKPDVMLICALKKKEQTEEERNSDTPEKLRQRRATQLFAELNVPAKHQPEIARCLGVAWKTGIAQKNMSSCFGTSGGEITDQTAKACGTAVVSEMKSEGIVVGVGLFFWLGLGYYMIMIFTAILRLDWELQRR